MAVHTGTVLHFDNPSLFNDAVKGISTKVLTLFTMIQKFRLGREP